MGVGVSSGGWNRAEESAPCGPRGRPGGSSCSGGQGGPRACTHSPRGGRRHRLHQHLTPPPQVMAAPPVAPREGTPAQHRHLEPKGRLLREHSLSDAAMDLTGHSPHFPCRRKRGFREALGGWDPALPCAPFRGIERTLLWPGRGPAAVGALRLGALSTAPCLPGTWGPGSQRFPRGPGSLVSSAGTAAATCPLLPVRTQTGPWVLAGWAGTGGTRPVLTGPAVELDCAPTAPPPAPHARGTAPGRRD